MIEGRRAAGLLRSPAADESVAGRRVVLGLPYDGGIPTRPGARFGPHAIREALSGFTSWDGEREVEEVLDLGDLSLPTMNGREAHAMIQAEARRVFAAGARPIFLGGDHGCTGSIIRGLAAARPEIRLALISIDAHLDVREYADDAHLSSGTPFRRALETPILTGGRTAMIGIRRFANAREHESWAREAGVHILAAEEVEARGAAAVARALPERRPRRHRRRRGARSQRARHRGSHRPRDDRPRARDHCRPAAHRLRRDGAVAAQRSGRADGAPGGEVGRGDDEKC
jgi:arginase family enzyme